MHGFFREMRESAKTSVRQRLEDYLKKNHLRQTPERFAVLDAAFSFSTLFSLEELNNLLDSQNFHVSRTTLYNSLNLFQKLHFIEMHALPGGTRYEAITVGINQIRRICTVCGSVVAVRNAIISTAVEGTHLRRFRKDNFSLCIYGVCSTCQARITREKNKIKHKKKNEQRKS